jgi:glycosyltransferase involved in cell wall biosynthesis
MPVFDEAETVQEAIERVSELDLPDTQIEIVIVESNSTDGSRELVAKFEGSPGIRIIYEPEPRGKGHAVREALKHVTGDILLIQDADLEYTVADYPALLGPIMEGRVDFTLGCRHIPGQAMRVMPENRILGWVINSAHWGFTVLFDAFYGVRLHDPFTMYKVFRRECVEGVEFVSDRFDFDWELVAKLIRLGYPPLEVPVTYTARSFASGKKIRLFRDPPTWLRACLRFRLAPIRRNAEAVNPSAPAQAELSSSPREPTG